MQPMTGSSLDTTNNRFKSRLAIVYAFITRSLVRDLSALGKLIEQNEKQYHGYV